MAHAHWGKSQLYGWFELPIVSPLWVLWFPPMAGGRGGTGQGGGTVSIASALRKSDFISREVFTGMAKMKRTDNTKCGQGSTAIRTLSHC